MSLGRLRFSLRRAAAVCPAAACPAPSASRLRGSQGQHRSCTAQHSLRAWTVHARRRTFTAANPILPPSSLDQLRAAWRSSCRSGANSRSRPGTAAGPALLSWRAGQPLALRHRAVSRPVAALPAFVAAAGCRAHRWRRLLHSVGACRSLPGAQPWCTDGQTTPLEDWSLNPLRMGTCCAARQMPIRRMFGGDACACCLATAFRDPRHLRRTILLFRTLDSAPMSAEAALNKSLDDLIAEQRQKKPQASRETDRQAHLASRVAAAPCNPAHPPVFAAEEGDSQRQQAGS